jgi:Holliday junction resolvase RusA-like endonuclease
MSKAKIKRLDGIPIVMSMVAKFAIPKSVKNRPVGSAHLFDPDVTNVAKAIEDGCQGVLYVNDNCIHRGNLSKVWSNESLVEATFTW